MTPLHIRRLKLDDWPNRADLMWVLFEEGQIDHPIRILTEIELGRLMDEVDEQNSRHGEKP